MYRCHVHFYLLGRRRGLWDGIKEIPPLEHFTHTFTESDTPEPALMEKADVILADLQDMDGRQIRQVLCAGKEKETELILLADKEQIRHLLKELSLVKDIWTLPMTEAELHFRFQRWQQAYKMAKDFWLTRQYLQVTIDSTPNLIWYKDKDGVHRKVNRSFCKAVNKTRAQVEGRRHAYIWDVEEDDPACIESEELVMQKKKTCVSEETIVTGDGQKLLTTYKSPLYDVDGSVMGTMGVAIDITQERLYETELLKKTKTLETIFTTLDCGVMRHTVDGSQILSINQTALKLLGYESQEELMAGGFDMVADSVVEEDKEILRDAICELQKEGDSVNVEYRVRHGDGELLDIMGSVKLMRENGKLFYQRFLLDCTEQKQREKMRQQEQERRHMELIHALGIDYNLICYFDLESGHGSTLQINNCQYGVLERLFPKNLLLGEHLQHYINECVYENDREMLRREISREALEAKLALEKSCYINYRTLCNHDEMRYFQMKAVRSGSWERKEGRGVVLGFRSIDQEIRSEMEKRGQLENALVQSNKANMAKNVFLSNMSHDIRTPMNAIIGFTTLASHHIDSKSQVEGYLKKIMASGKQLLHLINDVLDMSHLESGEIHLDEQPCDLFEMTQNLQELIKGDLQAKRLHLYVDQRDISNKDVYCDKRLQQILLNILGNSVKYTDEGDSIYLRLRETPGVLAQTANYEFSIRDTGIGMSREFVTHIFEPFERERNSTLSGIQGAGLGMAITKSLVDLMNGSIAVESEAGVGTEVTVSFTFRLRFYEGNQEEEEKNEQDKAEILYTGRLLLVEDNTINQEIAEEILNEAGFTVEIADNGQIAVDMVRRAAPGYYRLVLMDIQMPVMDGYKAAKAIRSIEDPAKACVPIVAMTANAFEEDRRKAFKQGMNGYVPKPIDLDVLMDTIRTILK